MVKHPYICDQCGRSFIEQKYLERHKLKHVGQEMVHQCFVCDKKFDKASKLQRHSKTLIRGLPCKCCICGKEYDAISSLEYHATVHRKDWLRKKKHGLYKCTFCSVNFSTPSGRKNHMLWMHSCVALNHHSKKDICGVCGKAFTFLERHKSAHGLLEASVCFVCGKKFDTPSELKQHSKTLIYNTPYSCCICGETFTNALNIENHGSLHRNGRLFKCPQCSSQFTNSSDFNNHISTHEVEKAFACTFCSKRYITAKGLRSHVTQKHSKHWSHSCSFCGMRFETQGRLEAHILTHMDLFTCSLCGEGFSCQDNLKKHMFTHREERHDTVCMSHKKHTKGGTKCFSCSQCGEEFSSRKSLREHPWIHSSQKHGQHYSSVIKIGKQGVINEDRLVTSSQTAQRNLKNKKVRILKESPMFTDCYFCVEGFLSHLELEDHLNAHQVSCHKFGDSP